MASLDDELFIYKQRLLNKDKKFIDNLNVPDVYSYEHIDSLVEDSYRLNQIKSTLDSFKNVNDVDILKFKISLSEKESSIKEKIIGMYSFLKQTYSSVSLDEGFKYANNISFLAKTYNLDDNLISDLDKELLDLNVSSLKKRNKCSGTKPKRSYFQKRSTALRKSFHLGKVVVVSALSLTTFFTALDYIFPDYSMREVTDSVIEKILPNYEKNYFSGDKPSEKTFVPDTTLQVNYSGKKNH